MRTLSGEIRRHPACAWLPLAYAVTYADVCADVCARSQVKYDGIRPAPGYPSQPDHTEKEQMWQLLSAKDLASIELTESLGTHFTRFTGTKVHILTQLRLLQRCCRLPLSRGCTSRTRRASTLRWARSPRSRWQLLRIRLPADVC